MHLPLSAYDTRFTIPTRRGKLTHQLARHLDDPRHCIISRSACLSMRERPPPSRRLLEPCSQEIAKWIPFRVQRRPRKSSPEDASAETRPADARTSSSLLFLKNIVWRPSRGCLIPDAARSDSSQMHKWLSGIVFPLYFTFPGYIRFRPALERGACNSRSRQTVKIIQRQRNAQVARLFRADGTCRARSRPLLQLHDFAPGSRRRPRAR